MKRIAIRVVPALALLAAGYAWVGSPRVEGQATGQPSTRNGEWPMYTADLRGRRYSPLDQINGSNFSKLEVAWRFKTDNLGPRPENKLEGTPLMVKGVMYATAGTRRAAIALNPANGELKWMYSMDEGERATRWAPRQLSGRGLSYWTDGRGDERILYVTTGYRLVALNAKTGQPIQSFGTNGVVDLKQGVMLGDKQLDLEKGEIGLHSTPTIVNDMVIVGSWMFEGLGYRYSTNAKGLVRAYDVKTGKQIWRFNTIPGPGEFGNDTWEGDSWKLHRQHRCVDPDLRRPDRGRKRHGLPAGRNAHDRRIRRQPPRQQPVRGVDRRGRPEDRCPQVALPADSPRPVGPRQLVSLVADGRQHRRHARKVLAQPTKQGWLYVFDRITGQPIWPIEERPVPQTNMDGEKTAPTQPFPDQSAALRAHIPEDRRRDRLHAGAARAGAEQPGEVPLGTDAVRAAGWPERSASGIDQHRQHDRWRELAGFRVSTSRPASSTRRPTWPT